MIPRAYVPLQSSFCTYDHGTADRMSTFKIHQFILQDHLYLIESPPSAVLVDSLDLSKH